ncbi:putative NADP-dependent alcohol dehydrogenase C 2 [Coleophoma cylindrospora]|uniref:Putative NADP-dependent alcohol dehydrogenase C 2 n=1 Tax=Coleophoma cylindrospora TaxID=1849047 RepID=A0A3D8QH51_9HELO|nr:putative NADP-dependent alcohol dehydrogenase C 2 [Coleophoma cylindrospora]
MVDYTVFKGSKSGAIVKATTTREIKPDEVLIKVTHSGLCGTDEHFKHADMGLGHEGAGVVEQLGSAVTTFAKGDSVGWGYLHSSCKHCKQCLTGKDTLCSERQLYGYNNLDQGSFSHYGVWKADFVFKIPDSIPREFAAPLMCGGATVFSALNNHGAKPTDRVGVIGIGGLGHLAIQFAAKMGMEVVVFSGSDSKKEEALSLGASEFYVTRGKDGPTELKIGAGVDHLIVTTSFNPDWNQYLPVMAPGCTVYPLTVTDGNFEIPQMGMIAGEIRIQGSLVAARQVHRDMLTFAAHHKILPMIEQFPMTEAGITEAMKKLADGKMRYRGVVVAP